VSTKSRFDRVRDGADRYRDSRYHCSRGVSWNEYWDIAHIPKGHIPIQNGGELVVLYCFLFLYVASRGTVAWGVRR
jgi:hypothetical protein